MIDKDQLLILMKQPEEEDLLDSMKQKQGAARKADPKSSERSMPSIYQPSSPKYTTTQKQLPGGKRP